MAKLAGTWLSLFILIVLVMHFVFGIAWFKVFYVPAGTSQLELAKVAASHKWDAFVPISRVR